MKSLEPIYFICVFQFICLNLNSQISNSEILDHSEHRTMLTSFLANKGDIIYVIENDQNGYASTQVKVSKDNKQPENILTEELKYRSKSKWFYDSNNNLRIYLFGLANSGFDDFSADFVEVKEDNNTYTSKRISNPFKMSLEGITSIALDSLDQIYTLTNYPRLQMFETDSLKNEIFPSISSNVILHSNKIGEVFLFDSGIDTLFKVNELQMEFIAQLDLNIKELKNIDDEIWALSHNNKLYVFDSKFQDTPQEIPISFSLTSLNQISKHGSDIYFLEKLNEGFRINTYSSKVFSIVKEYQEDFASSSSIHSINDSLFLTSGQFEIEGITNQAFLRGYNINQEFKPERRNVLLKNFDLFYLNDTLISGAPDQLWNYGINYTIENLGSSHTTLNSVFTSDLVEEFAFSDLLFEQHISKSVPSNASLSIDTSRLIAYFHPTFATASVTGSDYKFNEFYQPIEIGVTTSTTELPTNVIAEIYPNPFTSYLNIQSELNQNISMYNSLGDLLFQGDSTSFKSQYFGNLSRGNYYVLLQDTSQLIKLIKMNEEP